MAYDKIYGLKETIYTLPPPKFFQQTWKNQIQHIYPDGIDNAAGCEHPTGPVPSFEPSKSQLQTQAHKVKVVKQAQAEKKHMAGAGSAVSSSVVHDLMGLNAAQPVATVLQSKRLRSNVSL